ncbi:MAG: hypothetical protein WBB82_17845 [Limnothrix sp.]
MVKATAQIRTDLTKITDRVTSLKHTLEELYTGYLDSLGASFERQLVLASYQLCTRVYPQKFLELSYDQRQKMQQALRQIGQETHATLSRVLTNPPPEEPDATELLFKEELEDSDDESVEKELLEVFGTIDEAIAEADPDEEQQNSSDKPEEQKRRAEMSELAERIAESLADMMQAPQEAEPIDDDSPEQLVQWFKATEKNIRKVLNQGSRNANRLLQSNEILAKNIPEHVLDLAIQNNPQPNASQQASNLVNMVIEADMGQKKKRRIRVTAIHMKLTEIEFGDAQVSSKRHQIREQLAKVKKLIKHYKKSKKDLAIAEAETAWRSSWHEE